MSRVKRTVLARVLVSGVLAAVLLAASPAAGQVTYVVRESAAPCLNLRSAPNIEVLREDCLVPGTQVTHVESQPYWRKVRLADGREGWAAKKFLEPVGQPATEPVPAPIPSDAWLEVHFVDVGQGDGIWIHTHDDGIQGNGIFEGQDIIIDGGPNSADDSNELLRYLREFAHHGAVIDALIVTHPHDDHYPGAETILRHFEVRSYYDPGYPKGGTAYPAFRRQVGEEVTGEGPVREFVGRESFDAPDWGSELEVEFLYGYPGSDDGLGSKKNTIENNSSIVLRLAYGQHVFLFMGDAEGKDRADPPDEARYVERILLDTVPAEKLETTVLKVGHHGSETSSTLPFIEAVDPEIVVVMSGRRNYGGGGPQLFIPDASTLRRYCCNDPATRIYRTDQNDAEDGLTAANDQDGDHVVVRTNGNEIEVRALEGGQPFEVNECRPACGSS